MTSAPRNATRPVQHIWFALSFLSIDALPHLHYGPCATHSTFTRTHTHTHTHTHTEIHTHTPNINMNQRVPCVANQADHYSVDVYFMRVFLKAPHSPRLSHLLFLFWGGGRCSSVQYLGSTAMPGLACLRPGRAHNPPLFGPQSAALIIVLGDFFVEEFALIILQRFFLFFSPLSLHS